MPPSVHVLVEQMRAIGNEAYRVITPLGGAAASPSRRNKFATSQLFGKAQGALWTSNARPQQQLTNEILCRGLKIAISEIRCQQRRRDKNPKKCFFVEGDRRSGHRETQDDYELNRKMQQIARIGHVPGSFDYILN